MEKNVPLLKLIHDPWSIKTMLSSRFTSVPLHPRAPTHNNTPSLLQGRTEAEGGEETEVTGGGRGAGVRGRSFLSVLPRVCWDVLLWFPVSRLWEGAGALKTAGSFTLSKRQNWIDRSLRSPQEGGGEEEYIRLFPLAGGVAPPPPPPPEFPPAPGDFLPRIFQFFFISRI